MCVWMGEGWRCVYMEVWISLKMYVSVNLYRGAQSLCMRCCV